MGHHVMSRKIRLVIESIYRMRKPVIYNGVSTKSEGCFEQDSELCCTTQNSGILRKVAHLPARGNGGGGLKKRFNSLPMFSLKYDLLLIGMNFTRQVEPRYEGS